jgi:sigma-B regulation protein RsbU (phosphoserine phosphatase)
VYAYLYAQGTRAPRANATGFCRTLARLGGLAMANLQRIEIERRVAGMRAQLGVAAITQRVILPNTPIRTGPFVCHGKSLPGDGYLGGDFFDLQILPGERLAVSLGDVAGHGVQASILMAVAQGFLHAALAAHGDLARAASELNQFVGEHSHESQYLTLWLGLLDPAAMTLTYVNAGHGLAYLINPNHPWQVLDENGDMVIGITPDLQYVPATVPLNPDQKLLVVSDGILEQPHAELRDDDQKRRFGFAGLRAAVGDSPGDGLIDRLIDAVQRFAGTKELLDDASAVLVDWS